MSQVYIYIRYSSSEQREGDSYERQIKKAKSYCERNGYNFLEQNIYFDDGVSGYTGANRTKGKLGEFIAAVDIGEITPDSFLLVENLDRFSREEPLVTLMTLAHLKEKKIRVVILDDSKEVDFKSYSILQPLIQSIRSNDESARKSQLLSSAWAKKKTNALQSIITKRVPLWLKVVGEKENKTWERIPEREAVIKRIFKMSANGDGKILIARKLNKQQIDTFGKSKFWQASYVGKILKNPACYGVFIPYKGRAGSRKQDGPAIEGYYPAAITKDEFLATKTYIQDREKKGGRSTNTGKNLFSTLLICGSCGEKMRFDDKHNGNIYYVCSKARLAGNCRYESIRFQELESRILAKVPDMFGFDEIENEQQEDPKIIELRSKLHAVRDKLERLVQMGMLQGGDLQIINDQLTSKRREENLIHEDLNRLIGMQTRQMQEKESRYELKENINEILEGEFKGILSSQNESQRIRLKQHLAKVIKKINILFYYFSTGQLATWIAEIHLFGGRIITAERDAESQIYINEDDIESNEAGEPTLSEYWNDRRIPETETTAGKIS
jgi:DNA invertase Pin-like site-specific DNA recombinase